MRKTLILLGTVGVVAIGAASVVATQLPAGTSSTHQLAIEHLQSLHASCGDSGGAAGQGSASHVPDHMAKAIGLSTTQLTQIEQLATEACQQIRRTHEGIMAVLTPEQRAKVDEFHKGGHSGGGIHEWFKKLHGGR
jgi:hypothetical protein